MRGFHNESNIRNVTNNGWLDEAASPPDYKKLQMNLYVRTAVQVKYENE